MLLFLIDLLIMFYIKEGNKSSLLKRIFYLTYVLIIFTRKKTINIYYYKSIIIHV